MKDNIRSISQRPQSPKRIMGITPAEAEVIELAEHHNKVIADKRHVSIHTVKRQMSSAFEKLGVDNRTSAALRWAELRRAA